MSKRFARFLTAVFCLFLEGLMVWQMLLPDRERSDVENRTLQQRPALTLSSVLDGFHGLSGVALSVPSLVSSRGIERVLQVPMDAQEITMLKRSAATLKESLKALGF